MDPEKTLTFCHGLQAEEMTMFLQGLDATENATVPVKEIDMSTINEVVKPQGNSGSQPVVSPKYCPGVNNSPGYLCETGHCCGETGCCTYYYELWWFWLLWTVLILFSCFCAYRHRRAKLRIQQQQRQREINLIAYNGACNYPSSMLDLSFLASFKLPSYEEVAAQPSTPPPPYSSIFALQGATTGGPSSSYPHHHHHRHPCPPYLGPGPSGLTSSQSSDNYTSCSYPLGAMVAQKAQEEISPHEPAARPTPSPPKQALFSPNVAVFVHCNNKEEQKKEEEEEDEEEEDHFRHRRLTGDSGIEVCRCHVKREGREEEELQKGHFNKGGKEILKDGEKADMLHDSVDCSHRTKAAMQSPGAENCVEQRRNVPSSSSIIHKTGEAIITVKSS
uniref:WW domain binding protein 1 n=1 Tax=Amphiprion ocellaris TaxID=80972 RepID=A0AAQ5YY94_AMPOC